MATDLYRSYAKPCNGRGTLDGKSVKSTDTLFLFQGDTSLKEEKLKDAPSGFVHAPPQFHNTAAPTTQSGGVPVRVAWGQVTGGKSGGGRHV